MSDLTPSKLAELRRCCLTDPLHPDRHAASCPTCDNPAVGRLRTERDALRTWQERVALAAGIADEVAGYGVYLEADPDTAAEHVAGLLAIADTHAECPTYCGNCGEPLADTPCDHCGGSGCGPGTASGAYEECGWCAGAGKVHVGCAHLSYAELCAERDALATELTHMREARDNARAEVERLTAQVEAAKRICLGTHLGRTWPSVLNDVFRALDGEADRG